MANIVTCWFSYIIESTYMTNQIKYAYPLTAFNPFIMHRHSVTFAIRSTLIKTSLMKCEERYIKMYNPVS